MQKYVTVELLRAHIGDRLSAANLNRQGDITWDDAELMSCLEAAARSYNSLPPFIGNITDETKLDATTNMFLNGAALAAMDRRVIALVAQRVAFQAGGIATDPDGAVIDGMTKIVQDLRPRFEQEVRAYKGNLNMLACYGRVG